MLDQVSRPAVLTKVAGKGAAMWKVTYDSPMPVDEMRCLVAAIGKWALICPLDGKCEAHSNQKLTFSGIN